MLRKEQAGAGPHGYTWPEDGAVIEVDDEHASALVAIPDAGITHAEIGGYDPGALSEIEDDDDKPGAVDEAPKRRRATKKTTVTE